MGGELFSLCWNNFQNNLSAGFNALYQDEDLVDVTLAAEGKYIKAHKAVLSVCSPYFMELFRSNPCKHPVVILHDISYHALQNILTFMYQGEVSVNQEEIPSFMKIAESLRIKGLSEHKSNTFQNTNGFDFHNFTASDQQQIKRRPVKKLSKPSPQLKPIDTITGSSSATRSPSSRSLSPQYQLPAKQQKLETTELIKEEPIDPDDYDEHLDMSSMLDTTLGESPDSKLSLVGTSRQHVDTSSPGTLQCIIGRRGTLRLIVDGHTFYKKSSYKAKCFWYCKLNRHPIKCLSTCWTRNGNIVKWPNEHNHEVVKEKFNPEEDQIVPIEKFKEILMQAAVGY